MAKSEQEKYFESLNRERAAQQRASAVAERQRAKEDRISAKEEAQREKDNRDVYTGIGANAPW